MPEVKHVIYNKECYALYPCKRCLNGTMALETGREYFYPTLKCVLCGNETECRPPKRFEKKPRRGRKISKSEAKLAGEVEEKGANKSHKWKFSADSLKLINNKTYILPK